MRTRKSQAIAAEAPKTIHVVFKTHLDVGFTDYSRSVTEQYFNRYIPQAMQVAEALRKTDLSDRFIWTTGSWLIYEYLEQASRENRGRMEQAILAGDIAWHGLPFTTHSELMDEDLFRFGLSLSQEMDKRFGRKTIAAKMTDVPGHTRGIVPLLAEAGIQFLHIGVNPASTPPGVPPVFTWQGNSGAEVMVMYHKGSYGDLMTIPGMTDALLFAHTGDNLGPQSPEAIRDIFRAVRARFPGAVVKGSTMDAFAARLAVVKHSLPVITQEIGDTWIHGGATDPQKMARFRELLRLRVDWVKMQRVDREGPGYKAFSRSLLLVPEHTWGMDEKTHLADYETYRPDQLRAKRGSANFQKFAASWAEQRAYMDAAIDALGVSPLALEARQRLQALEPARPELDGWETVSDRSARLKTTFFDVQFDPQTGALVSLRDRAAGRSWASSSHPLGLFRYESFDQEDYDRFYRQYVINKRETASWSIPDFTKPGIAEAGAKRGHWLPRLESLHRQIDQNGQRILLRLSGAGEACQLGCSHVVWVKVEFPSDRRAIYYELAWFEKQANRLPEAIWFSFSPIVRDPHSWKLLKMEQSVSPYDVIRDGNRKLHGVFPGVMVQSGNTTLAIDSLDAALVAPGMPSLLNFNNRQPALSNGMHFLLYNNIWGTNFPMWSDDDARFRFTLRFE